MNWICDIQWSIFYSVHWIFEETLIVMTFDDFESRKKIWPYAKLLRNYRTRFHKMKMTSYSDGSMVSFQSVTKSNVLHSIDLVHMCAAGTPHTRTLKSYCSDSLLLFYWGTHMLPFYATCCSFFLRLLPCLCVCVCVLESFIFYQQSYE